MTSRNDLPSVILTRPSIAEQGQTSISQPQPARPASRTSSELYLDSPFGSPNPNASPSGSPVWSPAAASSGGSSYFPSPVLGPTNPSIIAGQSAGRNQHGYPTPPSQSDSGRNSPALSEVNSRPYLHRLDSLPGVTRGRGRQYSGTSDGSASSSPVRGYGKRVYSETYGLGLDEPEGPSTPPYTPEEATAGTKSGGRGMSGSVNLGALIDGRLERRGGGGVEEQYPAEQEYAEEKEHNKKRANPVLRVLRLVMPYTAVARILNMASGSSSSSGAIPFARGGKSNNKYSRRESTGTSSATIRSKKQDQRWSGKRSLGDGKRAKAIKLLMLLVVVYYGMQTVKWLGNRFIMGSEKAQFQVEDQEPTTSVGKRTNSVKKPKTHRVIDPFDPVEGLLRNLPQFVQDTSMLHPEEDGLVHVNMSMPAERHPIYQIIKEARVKWDQKLKKQSRTLKEAVEEYKRRNGGRAPPKGFDQWWRFIVEQDVQLPDEYDQITKDMHLFRAISPTELNERIDHASTLVDTFTISVHQGAVRTRSTYDADAIPGANERLEGQIGLIMDFGMEKWLGDFRAIYGVHDSPQGFIGYDHRDDLMTRVEDGEYYDSDEELDVTVRGWPAACPFGSPAREFNRFTPVTKKNHMEKSFIADHSAQFDLCKFPEQQALHGMLSGRRPHVQDELLPVFSLSKTSLNTDILGVPVEQWVESMPSIPWDQRTQGRLMWRGSNTGAYHSGETTWRQSHRTRLVGMADKKARGELTLLPAPNAQHSKGYSIGANVLKASRAGVNNQMLDISFAGEPLQCEQEDGTCDELRDEYEFAEFPMTFEEALEHKFIVDVDGNTWSSRFERLLSGGSLIFKSTIMPEWWTQRAQPWVHYVPINLDYSDLHDALTFFRGDIYGNGGEDALAQQIAQEGQKWAETHWRRADMAAYVGRMYLEWARLLARDRRSMDFVYSPEMELEREELGGDEIY